MFEIVVTESGVTNTTANVERFRQTVDVLDLYKLIAAINSKPRKARAKSAVAKKHEAAVENGWTTDKAAVS